jgi:DNA mismatch endonuclease (patch repair protein)
MQRVRQRDTSAESALRRELHARGLRYRVQFVVLTRPRRVADIVFVGPKVAIFVDGCFWHGCPLHATWPKSNAEFWRAKIIANQQRDADTTLRLRAGGWKVFRVWAHEEPREVAARIETLVENNRRKARMTQGPAEALSELKAARRLGARGLRR